MQKIYNIIIIGFIIVILSYALFITFRDVKRNMHRESYQEPKLTIALFKAGFCGHCTTFMKSDSYTSIFVNHDNVPDSVSFIIYDSDKDKDKMTTYKINSFPTILALNVKGDLIDTFNGDRSNKQVLLKFINDNLSKVN
jgi:thioredoxin-related protein